jgi:protein-disulfide isomerase-like protein with CxxC motif
MSGSEPTSKAVSSRLLQGAIAGLLCLASPACSADPDPESGASAEAEITSQTRVDNLDAAGFEALCAERHGTVEIMPHCGGFATAPGFAYDVTTQLLSEHSCKGANTCTGWNCVTDEPPSGV